MFLFWSTVTNRFLLLFTIHSTYLKNLTYDFFHLATYYLFNKCCYKLIDGSLLFLLIYLIKLLSNYKQYLGYIVPFNA